MASQPFDITSSAISPAFDPDAVFTIRRLLWKNEKMCFFVRKRALNFYELLQRPGPCEIPGFSPKELKYLCFFSSKPEVFLAEALEAWSRHDEKHIAVLINKIFLTLNAPVIKELEREAPSNIQNLLSELLDALHVDPIGFDDGLSHQPFTEVVSGDSSSPYNTCPMRVLLAQLQQAKALMRIGLAEQFSEEIFSRLKSERSKDPLFEKDLLEVLYGSTKLRACFATAQKDVPLGAASTSAQAPQEHSSIATWDPEPPHRVRYLAGVPCSSFVQDALGEKAVALIQFAQTALNSCPPKIEILERLQIELEHNTSLAQVVETLNPMVVRELRDTLLAVRASLDPNVLKVN